MKVIIHFNKPQFVFISATTKKPITSQIISGVELIINNKDQLIIEVEDGGSITYEQKIVGSIVVKKENKQ